jgi:large subunit ribosomal protein L5
MARLQELYQNEIRPKLAQELGITNPMAIPRIQKVTINMGVGESVADRKVMEHAVGDMTKLAGQKPVVTVARTSVATFKIREGYPIGCKVTLRRERMYEFIDRLVSVAIPRMRDFRGISPRSFDGRGNFTMGVTEQIIFPEIDYDKVDQVRGMDICFTTTARNNAEGLALLRAFSFPFRNISGS